MARDSQPSSVRTEVTPSLTAELIFAANLAATAGSDRPGAPAGWAAEQRLLLPAATLAFLPRLSGFWWPTMGLVDFLCLGDRLQDPEGFLADLAGLPLERFLSLLLNSDLSPSECTALIREPGEWRALAGRFSRFSQGTTEAHEALFQDPEGHRQGLLGLLRASDTVLFREAYARLVTTSQGSVRTLVRRLETEDPMAVAESLRERPLKMDNGPFDRFTFVPSLLIGHRHIQSWGEGHVFFFHQEGAQLLTAPTQTGNELAEFLKVLADPTRMDILRLLCCGPSYGKEIAASLKLTTATVSRHLDQLKAAGLVREDRADTNNVKRLRYVGEMLDEQWERLRAYLLHN